MQWNANELAWAKKNNVQLGQKKKGGLMNVGAYRKMAGHPPQGGGGRVSVAGGGGGQLGGGGLIKGRGTPNQAAFGANQPTIGGRKGSLLGGLAGGALGAAGAGGFSLGGMKIAQAASMGALKSGALGVGLAASPIGWGLAGAAIGAKLLGKKSNKQFEGTIKTGGHQAFKQGGGQMAVIKKGYIPTKEEFVQHGRSLLPEDSYAHDYGGTLENAGKYYENFRKSAQGFLDQANAAPKGSREQKIAMAHYQNTMGGHGFDIQKAAPPPKPRGRSAPAAPEQMPAPAPTPTPPRKEVSKPGSGLEDTIISPKGAPKENRKRRYLTAAKSVLSMKKKKDEDED